MPNNERIDSIIDTAAINKEVSAVIESLDVLKQRIIQMGNGEGFKTGTEGMAALRA